VFKPEAGTANGFFQPYPSSLAQIHTMQVFDRWGDLVCRADGSMPQWDGTAGGKKCPPAVYTYRIEYLDLRDNLVKLKFGDVLLVR
jgi:gliding motility-associated-like protein